MEEKEIKIKLSPKKFHELQKHISSKSKNKTNKNLKDIYFDTDKMYITNLNRGLRARFNFNKAIVLEFKSLFFNKNSKLDNPWFIEEIEMKFPLSHKSLLQLTSILRRLKFSTAKIDMDKKYTYQFLQKKLKEIGLIPKIVVEKDRVEYKIGPTIFVFDHIDTLGYFLEIETKDEEPISILKSLGINKYEIVRNGYNDMLSTKIPNYLSNEQKQKKFKVNPSWNVLPTEIDLLKKYLKRS